MARRAGVGGGRSAARAGAIDAATRSELHRRLLAWYLAERRDLPWRRTRDPYAIWLSEAMLQQTRVETVLAFFGPFLARFPDAATLAAAPEAEVLARWSGLGYYRRARNLQAAARVLVERHAGRFPEDPAAARDLPGVGAYTAGAVLSIAFDRSEPVVDGNVARVLSRWFALDADPAAAATRRRLWELAAELVPARGAGDWNQALMELGATLCTPRAPRCDACPVAATCRARALGRAESLPRSRPRPAPREVGLEILLVPRGARWLLVRRGAGEGRMAGLLEFPTREVSVAGGALSGLFPPTFACAGGEVEPPFEVGRELGEVRHAITNHRIRARVLAGRARGRGVPPGCVPIAQARLGEVELTGMARKILSRGLLPSARG